MAQGRIRDFTTDSRIYFTALRQGNRTLARREQAEFRRGFTTSLHAVEGDDSPVLATLAWGSRVELPQGLASQEWTPVLADGNAGFVRSAHVVETAYVARPEIVRDPKKLAVPLELGEGRGAVELLWGDLVQIISKDATAARARARGYTGTIALDKLTPEPLLECYFVDVGQGDGVLIRFPDERHMLIDGGLARSLQQTGKNAADFVDWKFFVDYGDWAVDLDWMVASHSDADHYGGLQDLVDPDQAAKAELDTLAVHVRNFGHPGLSRFADREAVPDDDDGLGPSKPLGQRQVFTRLLGDRADAEALVEGTGPDWLKLGGWWKDFIACVLACDPQAHFERLTIGQATAAAGNLPLLGSFGGCDVQILAPVTIDDGGNAVLPDLGDTSINSNGHSVCLRLDYGAAKILMTGDLNTKSMHWLAEAYGGDLAAWKCDAAKACHHGSDDVSFKFLEAINAAATVISSGDNEGHAHPRPEIVAASAISGRKKLSTDGDRVITPLIYMTEIERSVMLSEISRIEIANLAAAGQGATVLGKPVREFAGREFFLEADWKAFGELDDPSASEKRAFANAIAAREKPRLEGLELAETANQTRATVYGSRPTGVVGSAYDRKPLKRLRMMQSNIYGLVNVRTDGEWVMCASKRDNGERWTIHCFKAGED